MTVGIRRKIVLVAIHAVFVVSSCSGEADSTRNGVWQESEAWQLGERITLIGANDTLDGHDLFRIRAAGRMPAGHLVIADGSTNELRVFDETGALVSRFGRTGGGPEEFSALARLWIIPPDTIMTLDVGNARLGFWSESGRLLNSIDLPLDVRPDILARLADGSFVGVMFLPRARRPLGELWVDSMALLRIAQDGRSYSGIGRLPRFTTYAGPSRRGPGPGYQVLPLEPIGQSAAHHSAIFFGYGDRWQIAQLDIGGIPVDTARREAPRQPFTAELKELWLDGLVMRVAPSERPALRQFFAEFPTPDSLPAYDEILVDSENHLWVREFPPPGADVHQWSVFAPDLTWLGEVEIPAHIEPLQIGPDFIVALASGENDVEQVAVYQLDRRAGAIR